MLACRGSGEHIAAAIERANARLAEFQRISRWVLWPEPDLPRTSTGKVQAQAGCRMAGQDPGRGLHSQQRYGAHRRRRRLCALIRLAAGAHRADHRRGPPRRGRRAAPDRRSAPRQPGPRAAFRSHRGAAGHCLRQRAARRGADARRAAQAGGRRRGDRGRKALRWRRQPSQRSSSNWNAIRNADWSRSGHGRQYSPIRMSRSARAFSIPSGRGGSRSEWIRVAFHRSHHAAAHVAAGRAARGGAGQPLPPGPLLIVGNHVTAYDGPLIQYALAGPLRRHIAMAMAGEMLDDYRHWRNPDWPPGHKGFYFARAASLLAGDGAVQRLSAAAPARLPGELCPRGQGHGPRLQRARLSRGRALCRGPTGALPARHRAAGETMRRARAARGDSRPGRAESGAAAGSARERSRSVWARPSASAPKRPRPPSPRGCTTRSSGCWKNSERWTMVRSGRYSFFGNSVDRKHTFKSPRPQDPGPPPTGLRPWGGRSGDLEPISTVLAISENAVVLYLRDFVIRECNAGLRTVCRAGVYTRTPFTND